MTHLYNELPHEPTQMVLRCDAIFGVLGNRIGHRATGNANFDRPKFFKVTAHRCLRRHHSFCSQKLHELCLTRYHLLLQQARNAVMTLWFSKGCHICLALLCTHDSDEVCQQPARSVHPVLGLTPDNRRRSIYHFCCDLFTAVCRKAVKEEGAGTSSRH
mgnify:CR=1 FL=1